jgi:hypothetical protein
MARLRTFASSYLFLALWAATPAQAGVIWDTLVGGVCARLVLREAKKFPPLQISGDVEAMLILLGGRQVPLDKFLEKFEQIANNREFVQYVSRFPKWLRFTAARTLIDARYKSLTEDLERNEFVMIDRQNQTVKRTELGENYAIVIVREAMMLKEDIDPHHQLDAAATLKPPRLSLDQLIVLSNLFALAQSSPEGVVTLGEIHQRMLSEEKRLSVTELEAELSHFIDAGLVTKEGSERFSYTGEGKKALIGAFSFFSPENLGLENP